METQEKKRQVYPSDISREQFENHTKRTKPRAVDLYEVFCGVLYVLKSGFQWQMLPSDFPKWRTVYEYHSQWRERTTANRPSLLEQGLKKVRIKHGRKAETSFCIVDAQSVKNTDTAEEKGYDAGKKVSGIKRHVAVDTQGLPHAIAVTTANITDRAGALIALRMEKENLTNVVNVLADGGYTGENFAASVKELIPKSSLELPR